MAVGVWSFGQAPKTITEIKAMQARIVVLETLFIVIAHNNIQRIAVVGLLADFLHIATPECSDYRWS